MFQDLIALPEDVKVGIVLALTAALGFLFSLIPTVGEFLQGYKSQIALVLGGVIISYIEQAVPGEFQTVAVLALQLILAVLASFGVVVAVKKFNGHYSNGIK